ncbi:23S rRNA (cytidine(2498)-2'-O)-methyltransferase RlmM [Xanthomonadaceae bacterium XH05]|nr:23S rRNA (cytidine(2498)-2'-O)-methyltransferase RlmM [Xanthomonadaceae bacterium XH05]
MNLLILCRPGFEPEAAAEIADATARRDISGYPEATRGEGWVRFHAFDDGAVRGKAISASDLIFARQCVRILADLPDLDPADRITPMLDALRDCGDMRFGELIVEHPDSDTARPLAGLARSFGNALRPALRRAEILSNQPDAGMYCLHVCFLSGRHALLGLSQPGDHRVWPQGIPRLRVPKDAPSRSAQKLEEALESLMGEEERAQWLKPGMSAVDLGAAPGGWSFILARRNIHVTAIDNGPLSESVLGTGLVRHLRADGFTWSPPQPVDWMVCDMVEQPRRVAARMADWFVHGWCRRAIFNLKLPMKKRYAEVVANLSDFHNRCENAGVPVQTRARQLYHDREEITVLAWTGR